ncbi:MAG: TGS domain-containing protein [Candidatus Eisenbacteria bacterium]|uniref:TGS domain-containing protein n=1 Tax=Eiseniibacteriota bacterium TaxID=2212470 RepID=A0A538TWI8_UNCEI|nr:MAG: TGS domain-containing protein [Candidatus Eisenbacteria bacterium]
MPANLPPDYKEAERRFREASSHEEKLAALREMLALLPKHKGTDKLQADLRRRVSKLEEEGEQARKRGGHRFDPGHVRREGAGQWVLVGPPNAGKSALVRALTHAHPEVAPYPFTTRAPLPGMMPFEDVQVQLVDTPAVTVEHAEPYVPNLVHTADGVLVVLDVAADDLDQDWRVAQGLLERARVWPRARPVPADPLIIVKPVLVALNKSDLDRDGTFVSLARETIGAFPCRACSAEHGAGLEDLKQALFAELCRVRIYAKEPGKKPDRQRPFVLSSGATVHDLAKAVHKDVAERLKFARIWGAARFDGQQVDRDHVLSDRDVVELHV